MHVGMFRRQLPAIVLATMVVVAFAGVQSGFGAGDSRWMVEQLEDRGCCCARDGVEGDGDADAGRGGISGLRVAIIATDKSAPFETPLDLAPGDYKLGFCHRKDGVQKCETTEPGTDGIVARVTDRRRPRTPPAPATRARTDAALRRHAAPHCRLRLHLRLRLAPRPLRPPPPPTCADACAPPAPTNDGWSSNLKTGDVVARGTVWKVTVTPTPDEVDFWASGRDHRHGQVGAVRDAVGSGAG